MTRICMAAALLGLQGQEPTGWTLFLSQRTDRNTARQVLEFLAGRQGDRRTILVVEEYKSLQGDLLKWADLLPRGLELAPWDPEVPGFLKRYRVRRLPCLVAVQGGRAHRVYGFPREGVLPCRR